MGKLTLAEIRARYNGLGIGMISDALLAKSGHLRGRTSEIGVRATPENRLKHIYRQMWVDPDVRAAILDIRDMDRTDPRVKKIHGRMVRTAIKGGVRLQGNTTKTIQRRWDAFKRRLNLHRREKLESDGRGLVMEGNLPMQWVLDADRRVVAGIRMPTETIKPQVEANGQFVDPRAAYEQQDLTTGLTDAYFALWQLSLVRLTPDNYDDFGCLGRPYLDASRTAWTKLTMTEEDLVLRRRDRAPMRFSHVLEGAGEDELETYEKKQQQREHELQRDFYQNRKGGVTALQGDANLDQIADVVHLLDTFFAGAPAPKGLFGYADDLNRDILEDLKRDYYDEIDAMQDTLSYVYYLGFCLDLLLSGINPDTSDFDVVFAERRTDTPNQRADLALKYQALDLPHDIIWETVGQNPSEVLAAKERQQNSKDPYPEPERVGGTARPNRVNVTPGNDRKGESATTVSTRREF